VAAKVFSIKNYYERDIPLDAGGEGDAQAQTLRVRVRRFTIAELQVFMRGYERIAAGEAERFIYRLPDGDEQALRPDGRTFVVPHTEIARRRLAEMSAETKAAFLAAKEADDAHLAAFCAEQVAQHVWLPPGDVLNVLGDAGETTVVTDGAGLVKVLAGNLEMMALLTRVLFEENTLGPEKKRLLRSLSASSPSSPTPSAAAPVDGARPAPTAEPAEIAASVASAPASADPAPSPSGSIETSRSTNVP
jgi:hypothetical protein